MSSSRIKLYTKQNELKSAIEVIEAGIETTRHCQLTPTQKRLESLWKEFDTNHQKIIKDHGIVDDDYFKYKIYENMKVKIKCITEKIEWLLNSEARVGNSDTLDNQEKETSEPLKLSKLETLPIKANSNNATKQTQILTLEFFRCVEELETNLEEVDLINTKVLLNEMLVSWKEELDNISTMYMKLLVDHTVSDKEIMEVYKNIKTLHKSARFKVLEKLDILSTEKKVIKLKDIQIPHFNGNIEEWSSFHDMYKTLIHEDRTISNVEKMCQLKSLIKNEAFKIIKHLAVSEANYEVAWDILNQRFNNKRVLFQCYMYKILDQPNINSNNSNMIKSLHDTTNECIQGLKAMDVNIESADAVIACIITRKLDKEGLMLYEQHTKKSKDIQKLSDVLEFLEQQYQSLEAAKNKKSYLYNHNYSTNDRKQQFKTINLLTEKNVCLYCKKAGHTTDICRQFLALEVKERHTWAKNARICFKCLKHTFDSKCESTLKCTICRMAHNTTLHLTASAKTCVTRATRNVLLATAQVQVKSAKGEGILLKALIDQGSQTTFISEEAAQILQLKKTKIDTDLYGIGNVLLGVSKAKVDLEIYSKFKSNEKFKTEALILPTLSYVNPDPSLRLQTKEWQKYKLADPNFDKSERIDIVIGGDLFSKILLNGVYKKNGILGQKTKLGLILSGQLQLKQPKINKLVCMTTGIERFWEIEEVPNNQENVLHEDEICMNIFENTTTKDDENRFVVQLPFKHEKTLGNSYKKAMARFLSLEKKLDTNPDLKEDYVKFLDEYISLGHMEKVSNDKKGKYYLPHQPVVRESSTTTKLRVVFDASSKTSNGKSLNDILYIGPRLQKDVFDILIKFRFHRVAITADIEKMYRQIKIQEEDQNYLHILWRKSKEQSIQEYKLKTVTYGTASAPFLAVRTLFEIANECKNEVLKKIIKQDFYMDDLLTGADTIQDCQNIKEGISEQLNNYGFHLRKWCSNSEKIVSHKQQANENKMIDMQDSDKIKTLGMYWNPSEDLFTFKINLQDKIKVTKRKALSYLAKIFDPIGLLTPLTVTAKLFIQKLWIMELNWDDDLNNDLQTEWNKILESQHAVEEIKIPRWVYTMSLEKIQLLGFADASEKAYAAVIYIKSHGKVSILTAKSKVNPIKNRKTLPKLELCAAQLLVKLCSKIKEIINKDTEVYLWSDSMIVLAWIKNNKNKDKFVRTRVSEITTTIPNAKWRYIASKENPADLGSRGISSEKLCKTNLWWCGPEFLQKPEHEWPNKQSTTVTTTTINSIQKNEKLEILNKYSSFRKLRRVLAYVLRFINKLKGIQHLPEYLTVEEIQKAEILIIKMHQNEEWGTELTELRNKKQLNHRHKLANLYPYIDKYGLMRVGGRLHFSNLTHNQKHPVLVQKSPLAYQIINDAHKKTLHGGNRLVESIIRRKYWIINAKAAIKKFIRSCPKCIRYRQNTKEQLMGNLPEYRVNLSAPFDHCGIDYAGPVQIKFSNGKGQRAYKGYIAVFICMTTKAVHLEAVSSLSSEAFLAALKRFFARRGKSTHMYSDNGTNFVGASRLLDKEFFKAIQQNSSLAPILEEQQIKWHFIPAASPHFGGLWEAAVKSMKHHLRRVIGDTKLTFEELTTLLSQIEAVLNSRPLQVLGENDIDFLTPGHFLIGRPLIECPEASDDRKIGCLDRWKLIQKLKRHFWKQWMADYLTSLQQRYKWKTEQENLKEGQVVIVKNEETYPARWPLGRITEVHPGKDGLVRTVTIKTEDKTMKRPISKICPLENACIEESRPNKPAKKIASNKLRGSCSIINMLALITLMIAAISAQPTTTGYAISQLKPSAIYLDNIGSVHVTASYWNLVVYFNTDSFFTVISKSEEILKAMTITCKKLIGFENQCEHFLEVMKRQLENMKTTNQEMFPSESKRKKRAPFEFVGSMQHVLFGIMDADDREAIEMNMKNILDNQYDLKFLMKKQTSVVDSTLNILRSTTEEITTKFETISDRVNNVTETMKEVYFVYRESIKFFMIIKELQMIVEENEKVQAELIEMLIDINHGKLNPALLTPTQLQEEIIKIKDRIPEDMSLPGNKVNQLQIIYRLMRAKATIIDSQLAISVTIPLFRNYMSQIYRIIPIPIDVMGSIMSMQARGHYLIYNFNMNTYHVMAQSELNSCQVIFEDEFVCDGGWSWMDANDRSCEVSALKPQNKPNCKFQEAKIEAFWTKLHQANTWLFKLFNKTSAHILCQTGQQEVFNLPLEGTLLLKPGCTIRVQGATMTTPYIMQSKRKAELKTALTTDVAQVSELNMMPLTPMMANHSNQIQELMKQLEEIKKDNIELRGLNFHHYSGHLSLFLVLIICIVITILVIRKLLETKRIRALNFAP